MLSELTVYIKSIRPINNVSLPCLNGWLSNIAAPTPLFEELRFDFLLTNHLNQDCLENLFFQIRSKGGSADNPKPQQFRMLIRSVMVDSIPFTSGSTNCELDMDQFLLSFEMMSSAASTEAVNSASVSDESSSQQAVSVSQCSSSSQHHEYIYYAANQLDNRGIDLQQSNTISYIGGHILSKISTTLCEECKQRCTTSLSSAHDDNYQLIKLKSYQPEANEPVSALRPTM